MGEACPVMIPFRGEKDLGLVLQPPEGLAVKDPVPVPLVDGAEEVLGLLSVPACGPAAERRERRQDLFFCRLQLFSDRHRHPPLKSGKNRRKNCAV